MYLNYVCMLKHIRTWNNINLHKKVFYFNSRFEKFVVPSSFLFSLLFKFIFKKYSNLEISEKAITPHILVKVNKRWIEIKLLSLHFITFHKKPFLFCFYNYVTSNIAYSFLLQILRLDAGKKYFTRCVFDLVNWKGKFKHDPAALSQPKL